MKKDAIFDEGDTRDVAKDKLPFFTVRHSSHYLEFHHLFHVAASFGLIDLILMFLEVGYDVNIRDKNRATPLIAACRGGNVPIVRLLLYHGADPWKQQRNGISAFHWLMTFHDDNTPVLLQSLRQDHNSMVMDAVVVDPVEMLEHGLQLRWSPVHFAVTVRNTVVAKALLDAGASSKGGNTTPLNIAVANHCPEMTRLLRIYKQPSWQLTLFLHIGKTCTLKLLLLHGNQRLKALNETARVILGSAYGDINQKDDDGYNSLAEAIRDIPCDNDLSVLECLLDHGAKLDVANHQLIYYLAYRGDGRAGKVLDFLIKRRAVDVIPDLLIRAITSGETSILEPILVTGIDVNEPGDDGLTTIMYPILHSGNSITIQALLNRGANANATVHIDSETKSVLDLCIALPEGDGLMLDALING